MTSVSKNIPNQASIGIFIAIIVMFYLLMIRPQQQKIAKLNAQLKKLQKGDQVITAGGIIGTVYKSDNDDNVLVEVAENVRVKIVRSTISGVIAKSETDTKKN